MILRDPYNRVLDYLRISVTDKCNLRCRYCIPPDGVEHLTHDEVLRNEEFLHFIELFAELGVRKIRFTGGEPLVRKGIIDIIAGARAAAPGIELCLTTNGVLLDGALAELMRLGVRKLNISLDTMSSARYREITGRDYFDRVLANIERAIALGAFDLKINAVLFEDSLHEVNDFLEFFHDKDVMLRFIEQMPFTDDRAESGFVPADSLVERLAALGRLARNDRIDTSVAMMYDLEYRGGRAMRIGVIPPITHTFCARCNRMRLTCDGMLKTCLHGTAEYDLKGPYRMDMGDDALRTIIRRAVAEKPCAHTLVCDSNTGQVCRSLEGAPVRPMSKIGG
ncbi:MAG TPA: GTP 3',8-cyclase MoaA [Spirochaetota bacterium]|nr:GTP 3',8-cyclase MoaA [Spirochaetota bacterium]HOS38663.1 GTP 3',8-cyclase MoaA [Spirochaetota bacterium]HPI22835.1 GTP 3',8-cyclase MoaA [Spirochaetota bacterium]HPU87495.1 GTP 3',8-cyclase MoaA [Spirochaetota bacterium]